MPIKMKALQGIITLDGYIQKDEIFFTDERTARQLEIKGEAKRIRSQADPDSQQTVGPNQRQTVQPKTKEEPHNGY